MKFKAGAVYVAKVNPAWWAYLSRVGAGGNLTFFTPGFGYAGYVEHTTVAVARTYYRRAKVAPKGFSLDLIPEEHRANG